MTRLIILIIALFTVIAGCQKASTPEDFSAGKAIFDEHCALCHGPDGNVRMADEHDPETPDLRAIVKRNPNARLPRITLAKVIDGRRMLRAHGTRTMPIWGDRFDSEGGDSADTKIDALLDYIESIQIK